MDLLRHLPAFVQAAERGSFVAAGEALGLTGSAVSKAVALLERDLGVPLFVRSTRGITLTSDGRLFLERCQTALGEIGRAREQMAGARREVRGVLRVLMHPLPGRARVAAALPGLLARHPDLDVHTIFYEGYPGLEAAGADIALVFGEPDPQATKAGPASSLVVLPLALTPQWTCASPAYLANHGTPHMPQDLQQHQGIAIVDHSGHAMTQWRYANAGVQEVVNMRCRVQYNDGPACRAAAVAGHGMVRLPQIALERHVALGELQRVLVDWYCAAENLNLVYPASARRVPKVRAFIQFMQELFADLSPAQAKHLHGFEPPTSPPLRWKPRDPMSGQGAGEPR